MYLINVAPLMDVRPKSSTSTFIFLPACQDYSSQEHPFLGIRLVSSVGCMSNFQETISKYLLERDVWVWVPTLSQAHIVLRPWVWITSHINRVMSEAGGKWSLAHLEVINFLIKKLKLMSYLQNPEINVVSHFLLPEMRRKGTLTTLRSASTTNQSSPFIHATMAYTG